MNEIETVVRILTSSGLNVIGADDDFLYIEDPSCPVRAFQTFAEYAWIILCVMTVLLLLAWAVAKIRAVKGDLRNAFKNLFLICGIVSLTMPILNIIYGGDLIGTVCQKVKIPVSEVNSILATRAQNGEKEFALYEDIDIFDSGPKEPKEIVYNSDVSKSIDNLEKISNEIDAELTAAEAAAAKQSDENSANTETENLDNTVQQEPESQEQL